MNIRFISFKYKSWRGYLILKSLYISSNFSIYFFSDPTNPHPLIQYQIAFILFSGLFLFSSIYLRAISKWLSISFELISSDFDSISIPSVSYISNQIIFVSFLLTGYFFGHPSSIFWGSLLFTFALLFFNSKILFIKILFPTPVFPINITLIISLLFINNAFFIDSIYFC